jgi:hypothetical protein
MHASAAGKLDVVEDDEGLRRRQKTEVAGIRKEVGLHHREGPAARFACHALPVESYATHRPPKRFPEGAA